MIWICTICLLLVAAWLFFNAVNERRWVQAHSHDEAVSRDQGFLPSFSALTSSGALGADGKVSIDQENTPFARAVTKVQEKTSKFGDKYFESKAASARIDDPDKRPRSASEENTLFGRAVAVIGEKAERMDQKLEAKMKKSSSQIDQHAPPVGNEDLFARTSRRLAHKSDEIGQKVARRAKNIAQGYGDGRSATDEDGMFSKAVSKVSGGMDKMGAKIASTRERAGEPKDILARVAAKVGDKVSELDNKVIRPGKKSAGTDDNS